PSAADFRSTNTPPRASNRVSQAADRPPKSRSPQYSSACCASTVRPAGSTRRTAWPWPCATTSRRRVRWPQRWAATASKGWAEERKPHRKRAARRGKNSCANIPTAKSNSTHAHRAAAVPDTLDNISNRTEHSAACPELRRHSGRSIPSRGEKGGRTSKRAEVPDDEDGEVNRSHLYRRSSRLRRTSFRAEEKCLPAATHGKGAARDLQRTTEAARKRETPPPEPADTRRTACAPQRTTGSGRGTRQPPNRGHRLPVPGSSRQPKIPATVCRSSEPKDNAESPEDNENEKTPLDARSSRRPAEQPRRKLHGNGHLERPCGRRGRPAPARPDADRL